MPGDVRVLVLYNPISGAGRSVPHASTLVEEIDQLELPDGRRVRAEAVPTEMGDCRQWLDPRLHGAELLVVVGGDGTMRMAAESAVRTRVPVFHYPTGTENLFARDYGMHARPECVIEALRGGVVEEADVLDVDGQLALLCASIGLDAEIASDLAEHRSGAIKHTSYLRPLLRQLRIWRTRPVKFEVEVDGRILREATQSFVLVANSSQYAMRLDPIPEASSQDGLIDVVQLPCRSILGLVIWAFRCRFRRQFNGRSELHARGRRILVRSDPPSRIQLDGDALEPREPHAQLLVEVRPGVLRVLRPSVREQRNSPA